MRSAATHLHNGLVAPTATEFRPGYGIYRVLVDMLGHKDLGGKTVLFVMDALWSGSEANDPPRKFATAPFYNDWTSSIFVSQDPIALESVCFDFLKEEFTSSNPYGSYPQMSGVDDHMMQAADSTYWPAGIKYDPENDGIAIGSLGVFEHWNNAASKQYTRNLGTGSGIELLKVFQISTAAEKNPACPTEFPVHVKNYPNPFNPGTTISFRVQRAGYTRVAVFDMSGREVAAVFSGRAEAQQEYTITFDGSHLASGTYFCRLQTENAIYSSKMLLLK
jgi:hypothetical protein